jgi:DNA-binding CsgD family transcriptional regulator
MLHISEAAEEAGGPSAERLALHWLTLDEISRVLVDETLRLLWANEAAKRSFEAKVNLELRDGAIGAYNRAQHNELMGFVLGASRDISSLCMPCDDKDGHYLFRVRQIASWGERRFLGLTFHRTGKTYRSSFPDLATAFQLTVREERVLRQMLEGRTATDIAEQLSLSIETVRSHIRNLYAKIGVSSRELLFAKVQPYRL